MLSLDHSLFAPKSLSEKEERGQQDDEESDFDPA